MNLRIHVASVLLSGCAGAVAFAQQQESRMNQILRQEPSGIVVEKDRTFYGGKTFHTPDRSTEPRAFYFTERFTAKPFGARPFTQTGGDPVRGRKFDTKAAGTEPRFQTLDADRKVETKTVESRSAPGTGTAYRSGDYQTRPFEGRGSAQGSLDKEFKDRPEMTIDQVRELLNKSK